MSPRRREVGKAMLNDKADGLSVECTLQVMRWLVRHHDTVIESLWESARKRGENQERAVEALNEMPPLQFP